MIVNSYLIQFYIAFLFRSYILNVLGNIRLIIYSKSSNITFFISSSLHIFSYFLIYIYISLFSIFFLYFRFSDLHLNFHNFAFLCYLCLLTHMLVLHISPFYYNFYIDFHVLISLFYFSLI
jgi:hypothetical protein